MSDPTGDALRAAGYVPPVAGVEKATARPFADLRSANLARQAEWDKNDRITLSYRGNELAGEVGEACNVIKKLDRERLGIRGSRDTVEHLAEELADVVICADLIAMHEGIDLLRVAVPVKFNATSEKVGLETRFVPAESRASERAVVEQALREIITETDGPRATVTPQNAFEHFSSLNKSMIAIREKALSAYQALEKGEA